MEAVSRPQDGSFAVTENQDTPVEEVVLKDPAMAAFLAWLIPGLGHWYQGRRAKAVLYFVCILGTFYYGVYLGGNREIGWGRCVYFSLREGDCRLPYLCQIGVGVSALPALLQASRMSNHQKVLWNGFMAPPKLQNYSTDTREDPNNSQPTINDLPHKLDRFFDLGTLFTMIGGLLNILAIYDAWGGPATFYPKKEEKEEKPNAPQAAASPAKP
jgi:hypothetical protein